MTRTRTWGFGPAKSSRSKIPDSVKARIEEQANLLIESALKPQHVKPKPSDNHFNYVVDI